MNVTNDVTTTTTTTTNAATTTNSRRLSRLDDVDSTFNDLRDEAEETDASSHAPGTLRDYKTKYNEMRYHLCTLRAQVTSLYIEDRHQLGMD